MPNDTPTTTPDDDSTPAGSHTQGPWRNSHGTVLGPKGERIAEAGEPGYEGFPMEAVANARLIAAAPDLLEALEEVRRWFLRGLGSNAATVSFNNPEARKRVVARARAAIAKAKGEAHQCGPACAQPYPAPGSEAWRVHTHAGQMGRNPEA